MKKIDILFQEYGNSHQNQINKAIHWVCVPLIFWSIIGFISLIPSSFVTLFFIGKCTYVLAAVSIAVVLFYARLSFVIAVLMLILMGFMIHLVNLTHLLAPQLAAIIFIIVFISSWIFQFMGHKIEGKKPSFLKDLQFLLVGPAWLLHFLLKKINVKY